MSANWSASGTPAPLAGAFRWREFRYFVYGVQILASAYYWDGDDRLARLSRTESAVVDPLVARAAAQVGVPYLAIDVGQLESGDWTVIEVGDDQFAGYSHVPLLILWSRLREQVLT